MTLFPKDLEVGDYYALEIYSKKDPEKKIRAHSVYKKIDKDTFLLKLYKRIILKC